MKKKRLLIALAVVLGAGACLLHWWEDVWLAVAYRDYLTNDKQPRRYHLSRDWMPGKQRLVWGRQVCTSCVEGGCMEEGSLFCMDGHEIPLYMFMYPDGRCETHCISGYGSSGVPKFDVVHGPTAHFSCACPTCRPARQ